MKPLDMAMDICWLALFTAALLFWMGCTPMTVQGISYYEIDNTNVDLDSIRANQIDAAWRYSEDLWTIGDSKLVEVRFWGRPIKFDRDTLYSGATWDNRVNVYIKPGAEDCLFRATNSGALVHEFGHVLQYQHGYPNGDPDHEDIRWPSVNALRAQLERIYCK